MKLIVEVINAHDLMPKDGEGSASTFVEVDFENQLSRTRTVPKNLNPTWNQKIVFNLDTTKPYHHKTIEVSVYNERRQPILGRNFLGRVRIPCSNIVKQGDEVYQILPLENKWFFSSVKGEIGLKAYIASESKVKIFSPIFPSEPEKLSPSTPKQEPESIATSLPPLHGAASAAETLEAGPKEEASSFDTSKVTSEGEEVYSGAASSYSIEEAQSSSVGIDQDPKIETEEPVEQLSSQQLDKHQVHQQPRISIKKRPQENLFTMHSVDPQLQSRRAENYNHNNDSNMQQRVSIKRRPRAQGTPPSTTYSANQQVHPRYDERYNLKGTGQQPRILVETPRRVSSPPRNLADPQSIPSSTTYSVNPQVHPRYDERYNLKGTNQQPRILVETPRDVVSPPRHHVDPQGYTSIDENYNLKETNPNIGEKWPSGGRKWMSGGDKLTSTHDLVEQMFYLYVRVVKAKDLPPGTITSSCDPYVEVKLGNYRGRTKHLEKKVTPEWNQVFAFSKDRIQSSVLEVFVKDKEMIGRDDYLGRVMFDLNEVPTRVPPDSPLAPQWYRLQHSRGEGMVRGNIMLAVWMGTQADEAFSDAWHSDAATVYGEGVFNIRSKVYVSPKLWYLRVNVIEAQDVIPNDRNRLPEVSVKVQLGCQVLRTKICPTKTITPLWNEDLVFVAAEPFEEQLTITVEDHVQPSKDEVLGKINLPLNLIEKRLDHRPVHSRWFNLEKFGFAVLEGDSRNEHKFSSRIHLRVCLEGGYHVLDESTLYISDQRPTARQLWKQPIGILEMGILGAKGLLPMKMKDGHGSTDAYCVAKYGQKWIRTRTLLDTFNPKWNEQYTWEVYDPCTVITLGVFDNCHLGEKAPSGSSIKDSRIGKVRIRLSTLEANKIYTNSYPLLVLHQHGVKKMGELQLTVRFTALSLANIFHIYGQPLLPKMHYLQPFTVNQIDNLRYQAMNIVAMRLGRAEPPLRKEVVEYMLDVDSNIWSMRRSKANFFRLMSLFSSFITIGRWFNDVCHWKNHITSILVHILFLILIWYPELILPTFFLYMFLIGLWNYRFRPRQPPHMDTKLSWAESVHPDELDEELDTFPTSRSHDTVRMRYDRLRTVAGRIQTIVGDIATQGERFMSLLSWRDPRGTTLFVLFSLCAAVVFYATPFRVVVLVTGFYNLRHPRFRNKLPCVPSNFFKRLPARTDSLL
ncbi:FT-interacting protein 1-like [Trifolium pratense]|uniref:FT-interacting protein 1-like n=1 Tax=Trifolium pratense TaxID=57577 RepID=UPI001E697D8F|nr:FT-interacting protein 1-like [Trifolium pratense]